MDPTPLMDLEDGYGTEKGREERESREMMRAIE